jgi:hypothetical protein
MATENYYYYYYFSNESTETREFCGVAHHLALLFGEV